MSEGHSAEKEKNERTGAEHLNKPETNAPTDSFVTDAIRNPEFVEASKNKGIYMISMPREMTTTLDYTCLRGGGYGVYHAFINRLPKMKWTIRKVDEWIEVTPTYRDYYDLTITQKNKLEGAIKQGLANAAQAVADYELLAHDARRYREMLDYFVEAEKGSDEHVLRSVFVDRVDAFTGENYSMITMVRRWPTIITDFIRMKSAWSDLDTIRKELDVTQAEATVLKTKNELFKEWKKLFLPNLKDRYARIETLLRARRKSIDEYRNWIKPYLARYKMMREKQETKPSEFLTEPNITPGWGQSQALTGMKLWCWRAISVGERRKAESYAESSHKHAKWVIHPYDKFVKEKKKDIEAHYNVTITDKEVEEILQEATEEKPYHPAMDPSCLYYMFFDIDVLLSLVKSPPPEGFESDNLMFIPWRTYIISQNLLLLHLIEIRAREKAFDKYIDEIVGSRKSEEDILAKVEKEFEAKEPSKKNWLQRRKEHKEPDKKSAGYKIHAGLEWFFHLFVRRGPYEPIYYERISKIYLRGSGPMYAEVLNMVEGWMKIE